MYIYITKLCQGKNKFRRILTIRPPCLPSQAITDTLNAIIRSAERSQPTTSPFRHSIQTGLSIIPSTCATRRRPADVSTGALYRYQPDTGACEGSPTHSSTLQFFPPSLSWARQRSMKSRVNQDEKDNLQALAESL